MSTREHAEALLIFQLHRFLMGSSHLVKDYAASTGLHQRDAEAVLLVWQGELAQEPLSPSELADSLGITRAAVSYLVDRLVEQGYVRRAPDPDDGRKTRLHLTEDTAHIGHAFVEPLNADVSIGFENRSTEDIEFFTAMLAELTDSLS